MAFWDNGLPQRRGDRDASRACHRQSEYIDAFQSVSYVLAIFSILAPVVFAGLIVLAFFSMLLETGLPRRPTVRRRSNILADRFNDPTL